MEQAEIGVGREVVKEFRKELPVKLTAAEIGHRQGSLVQALCDLGAMEDDKKAETTRMADEIKKKSGHIRTEADILNNREEMRSVEVSGYFDYATYEYCTMRLDTGEILTRRAMTTEERQGKLDFQ